MTQRKTPLIWGGLLTIVLWVILAVVAWIILGGRIPGL